MLKNIWEHIKTPLKVLPALFLALLLAPAILQNTPASAYTRGATSVRPSLQMVVGFDDGTGVGDSRVDYWTPVEIALSNNGPDFTGTLSANTYTSPFPSGQVVGDVSPWSYQTPISLPHGAQKKITLYVPFYENPALPRAIIATLRNSQGKVVLTDNKTPYSLKEGAVFIGLLSDQLSGFSVLANNVVAFPDPARDIEVTPLDASNVPDMAEVLSNFDVIILDDFTTSTLNHAQIAALQTWVNQGGVLIEVGGSQWQRTLGALPPTLLPVVLQGTSTLPPHTHLLPIGSPTIADSGQPAAPDSLSSPVTISTATLPTPADARLRSLSHVDTALAAGGTPLIVTAHQGQGVISYVAYDPTAAPLLNWSGTIAFWKGLFIRTLGDQSVIPDVIPRYNNGPGELVSRDGLFQILQPQTVFPVWALIFVVLSYILLIGPVRFAIVKRFKRPDWSWRIILSGAVVFSLLTYGLAFYQRAASLNSISIIQINQGGSSAHITTYFNVFIPGQGNYDIHIPARSLVQPVPDALFNNGLQGFIGDDHSNITLGQDGTDMTLLNVGAWTLHPIIAEQDRQLPGSISAQLTLQNTTLKGSVTNTLDTSLSDVYVLMPHGFAYIGQLPAGATQQINVPLHTSPASSSATLADQIATSNGLPAAYYPYAHQKRPQNTLQLRMAILSALSGEGVSFYPCSGPCSTHAIVAQHAIITPPFGTPKLNPADNNDPLLVAGAPATLMGWADQPLDGINTVTVNGTNPGGTHQNLVQMPLNLTLSGPANLPPDLIPGQVVNVQGTNVQAIASNVYSMTGGSITFEFDVPSAGTMTINQPLITQPQPASNLQIQLYNWTTSTWNTITLSQNTFTTSDTKAYTSSDGRVLLRLIEQKASPNAFLLGKPSISLNNAVI